MDRYLLRFGWRNTHIEFAKIISETDKTYTAQQEGWRARRYRKDDVIAVVDSRDEAVARVASADKARESFEEQIEGLQEKLTAARLAQEAAVLHAAQGEPS